MRWNRILQRGRYFFGICGAVGALALLAHLVVFSLAWRGAAAEPEGGVEAARGGTGGQVYRMSEHGHSVYVSYGWHLAVRSLAITMFAGLGIGVPGVLAMEALLRRRRALGAGGPPDARGRSTA